MGGPEECDVVGMVYVGYESGWKDASQVIELEEERFTREVATEAFDEAKQIGMMERVYGY